MATRSSWIDSWRRTVLGPNYAQWCSLHRVPESPEPLSIVTTSDLWPDSRIEGAPEYKNNKDNRIQSSEHRAPTSTWEADLKKIELFLMDWKAERNSQFDEIRESLRPVSFSPIKLQQPDRAYSEAYKPTPIDLDVAYATEKQAADLEVDSSLGMPSSMHQSDLDASARTKPAHSSFEILKLQSSVMEDLQRSRPETLADLISDSLMDNNLGTLQVIHKSLETVAFEIASDVEIEELDEKVAVSVDKIELNEMNPVESLELGGAHKMLDKMPKTNIVLLGSCFHLMRSNASLLLTDVTNSLTLLSECADDVEWVDVHSSLVFDPGLDDLYGFIGWDFTDLVMVPNKHETDVGVMMSIDHHNWIFDPGGTGCIIVSTDLAGDRIDFYCYCSYITIAGMAYSIFHSQIASSSIVEFVETRLQWDPGKCVL